MAIRTVRVGPDEVRETPNGPIACLSLQAAIDAVSKVMVAADTFGGVISIGFGRASTGLPGEMVTTAMIVNWQDRADAKEQREEAVAFEPSGRAILDFEEPDELAEPDFDVPPAPNLPPEAEVEPEAATVEQV